MLTGTVSRPIVSLRRCFCGGDGSGGRKTRLPDRICAFLLALSPLLMHYKGFFGLKASAWILILCLPYISLKLLFSLRRMRFADFAVVLPFVAYQVYQVVGRRVGLVDMGLMAVLTVYYLGAAAGCIDFRSFLGSALAVAVAASIGIILQYIFYYGFGFHVPMVATDLLLDGCGQWELLTRTGLISVNSKIMDFYRPSAFFLEPSHMFLYLMPQLFLLLLAPDITRFRRCCGVIVSVGLVFSTSGMGIAVTVGVWLLYLGFSSGRDNRLQLRNLFRWRNILHCLLFLALFLGVCLLLPSMQRSILRIFLDSDTINRLLGDTAAAGQSVIYNQHQIAIDAAANAVRTTAISGRTEQGFRLIGQMHGRELITGASGSIEQYSFHKSGFVSTMYQYGLIGVVLSYSIYLYGAIFLKAQYRWLAIILIVVSFFSVHTHGTFYAMYYSFALLSGALEKRRGCCTG